MSKMQGPVIGEVDKSQIRKAVEVLIKLDALKDKKDLFTDSEARKINLQFSFTKPTAIRNRTIKISLPHSLHHESTEVCLFVKDIEKRKRDFEPTVDHFEGLLKEKDVTCVSEIIPLMSLKTEYKPFEAKRNLSNRFDVFLADESIVRLLPTYLGKNFYERRKAPVQVNMKAGDLKGEIMKAVGHTRCQLTGRGACGMVTCAHTKMSADQITDNIIGVISKLAVSVPGGVENLKTFHIKTVDSQSVPLMVSLKSPEHVVIPDEKMEDLDSDPEDVTTVTGGKVKVTKTGELILFKDDGSKINLTESAEEEAEELPKARQKRSVMKPGVVAGNKSRSQPKKLTKRLQRPKSSKRSKKV